MLRRWAPRRLDAEGSVHFTQAGLLPGANLRSLDAIHVAVGVASARDLLSRKQQSVFMVARRLHEHH